MGLHEYHVMVVIRQLVVGNEQHLWDGTHYCSRCQKLLMLLPVRKQSMRTVKEAAMEYYYLGLLTSVNNTFHVNVRVRGGGLAVSKTIHRFVIVHSTKWIPQ